MSTVADAPLYGRTYQQFVAYLQEPGEIAPVLSPKQYVAALKIDLQDLADQAHIHRSTIVHAPHSKAVQDYMRQMLRVIKAAVDLNGDDVYNALFWYRNEPLTPFDYKTAETLVADRRADDVVRFLTSLQAGAAG
ncbi:MAG: DUF2384 domain-containing protein [Aquabacterium sp.]